MIFSSLLRLFQQRSRELSAITATLRIEAIVGHVRPDLAASKPDQEEIPWRNSQCSVVEMIRKRWRDGTRDGRRLME